MIIEKHKDVLFDYLMENCQDIITLNDLDYNYILCNRAFLKLFHLFHETEVVNKNIFEILSDQAEIIKENYNKVLFTREPVIFNLILKNPKKIIRQMSIPFVQNGEITGILSIANDITNEENLKSNLIDKVNELNKLLENEKKLKAQKELFLTTLTHDLKNPVQGQLMNLKYLQNDNIDEKSRKLIVENLIESSKYMQDMLYSMLQTYKFDNGIIELNKENIDINILIKSCINEFSALAKSENIVIDYSNKMNQKIFVDSSQLRRVISNLMSNALKFAYKNTHFIINIEQKNKNVVFQFINTGDEISENIKNHIFDKYITGNKFSGIGLGLYYSKKVIEAHDGNIYLETQGNMTKFIFELPVISNVKKSTINW